MGATEGARKLHLVILDLPRQSVRQPDQAHRRVAVASGGAWLRSSPTGARAGGLRRQARPGRARRRRCSQPVRDRADQAHADARIEIRKLFDLVRDDVMAATDRRQQPASAYGSVPGSEDFYFVGASQNTRRNEAGCIFFFSRVFFFFGGCVVGFSYDHRDTRIAQRRPARRGVDRGDQGRRG